MARDILTSLRGERNITRLYAPFLITAFVSFRFVLLSDPDQRYQIPGPAFSHSITLYIALALSFATYLLSLAAEFPNNRNFSLICILCTCTAFLRIALSVGETLWENANGRHPVTLHPTWAFYLFFNTLLAAAILSFLRFPKHPQCED